MKRPHERRNEMAEDILKRCGASVSINQITKYFKIGWDKASDILKDTPTMGDGYKKRYFYIDVVDAFIGR